MTTSQRARLIVALGILNLVLASFALAVGEFGVPGSPAPSGPIGTSDTAAGATPSPTLTSAPTATTASATPEGATPTTAVPTAAPTPTPRATPAPTGTTSPTPRPTPSATARPSPHTTLPPSDTEAGASALGDVGPATQPELRSASSDGQVRRGPRPMSPRTPARVVESVVLPGISRPLPAAWLAGWLRVEAGPAATTAPSSPSRAEADAPAAPSPGAVALFTAPLAAIGAAFVLRRRAAGTR